jgi:hypothetical protein
VVAAAFDSKTTEGVVLRRPRSDKRTRGNFRRRTSYSAGKQFVRGTKRNNGVDR